MVQNQFTHTIDKVSSLHFINTAIEFLVSVAAFNHINICFSTVRAQIYFYIVENLLKGYYVFLKNDSKEAIVLSIKSGHNIDILIESCRRLDPDFLKWLIILPKDKRKAPELSLTDAEFKEKYKRSDFYCMIEQGQSLKYGGITREGEIYKVGLFSNPSETIDGIIREVLKKYGLEKTSIQFFIQHSPELSKKEKNFLKGYVP